MQSVRPISLWWLPKPAMYLWLSGFGIFSVLWFLLLREQFHMLAALMIGCTLIVIAFQERSTAALLTIAYLLVMGDLRRLIGLLAPQPNYDPLLLVGPAVAAFLSIPFILRVRLRDPLSKIMFAILCLMVLEIFNPRQGGVSVGISGAFFYIVPMLWFWAGRTVEPQRTIERLLYSVFLPLGVLAAVLGLIQTFVGVLPYQKAWVDSVTRVYGSLYVGGSIRPFGFSVSAAEYSELLMLAFLLTISAFFSQKRLWCLLLPVLGAALILASGRGVIIRSLIAIAAMLVVRKRKPIRLGSAIGLGILTALLLFGVSQLASHLLPEEDKTPQQKNTAAQDSLNHQFGGLAHPFDSKYSTAGLHANMMLTGLINGFRYPIGSGLGYSTFAAEKLHGGPYDLEGQGSSEVDLTDMFIDLGFIGGLLYLSAVGMILYRAVQYVRAEPFHISLPLFTILLATTGGWLIAGQYSTSSFFFFVIGALTNPANPAFRRARNAVEVSTLLPQIVNSASRSTFRVLPGL